MFNAWFFLTVVLAIVDWIAIYRDHTTVNYFAKPATLLALIAWFTSLGGWQLGLTWFGLALIFSLAGDILLMLPDRFFIYGLYAFLITHICYIIGFNPAQPVNTLPTLLIGAGVLLISSVLFNVLRKAILLRQDQRKMENPLLPGFKHDAFFSIVDTGPVHLDTGCIRSCNSRRYFIFRVGWTAGL